MLVIKLSDKRPLNNLAQEEPSGWQRIEHQIYRTRWPRRGACDRSTRPPHAGVRAHPRRGAVPALPAAAGPGGPELFGRLGRAPPAAGRLEPFRSIMPLTAAYCLWRTTNDE
jgi:hypothetical protein